MHSTHHYTSTTLMERSSTRTIAVLLAVTLAACGVLLAASSPARAGTYVINNCPAAQAGNGDPGPWKVFGGEQTSKASCADGPGDWIGPRGSSMNAGSTDGVNVGVPNGSAITINEARVWWRVPPQESGGDDFAVAYDTGGGVGEAKSPAEWILAPEVFKLASTTTSLELGNYCSGDHSDAPCVFGGGENPNLELFGAQLTLQDDRIPAGKATGGGLTSNGTVTGTQTLAYTAEDPEVGVRQVALLVDGQQVASEDYSSECPYTDFLACPASEAGTLTWNTALVPDGQHTVQLVVTDAANSTATVYTATITTSNPPTNTAAPTLTAPSDIQPGTQLTAQAGAWSAPAGAGSVAYGYQWQDCNNEGNSCQAIPDAQAASYTATQSDVGHTLRVQVTASDNDGATTIATTSSSIVNAPADQPGGPDAGSGTGTGAANGTPASETALLHIEGSTTLRLPYTHRAFSAKGTLTDSQGQPITRATLQVLQQIATSTTTTLITQTTTSANGTFTVTIPAGPSRTIEIAYRAHANDPNYTATARITETVNASVKIKVDHRHIHSTGQITFTVTVAGPIPRIGAIVDLTVDYHNEWVTIRTPRTKTNGTVHITYQFHGSTGQYPFQVIIPAGQANFPYTRGESNKINITAT